MSEVYSFDYREEPNRMCYTCRKKGLEGICPECKRQKEKLKPSFDGISVPDFYKGKVFDPDILLSDLGGYSERYVKELGFLAKIYETKLPKKSAIISSKPRSGKTTFVHYCRQMARNHTSSIADYISTNDVEVAFRKGDLEELKKDVLFVRIPDLFNRWRYEDVIRELLVFRGNINKPVIITLDFPVREVFPEKLHLLVKKDSNDDPIKYPVLIELAFKAD